MNTYTVYLVCKVGQDQCIASYDVAASNEVDAVDMAMEEVKKRDMTLVELDEVSQCEDYPEEATAPGIMKVYGRVFFDV